jgi:hypothetical protein
MFKVVAFYCRQLDQQRKIRSGCTKTPPTPFSPYLCSRHWTLELEPGLGASHRFMDRGRRKIQKSDLNKGGKGRGGEIGEAWIQSILWTSQILTTAPPWATIHPSFLWGVHVVIFSIKLGAKRHYESVHGWIKSSRVTAWRELGSSPPSERMKRKGVGKDDALSLSHSRSLSLSLSLSFSLSIYLCNAANWKGEKRNASLHCKIDRLDTFDLIYSSIHFTSGISSSSPQSQTPAQACGHSAVCDFPSQNVAHVTHGKSTI